MGKEQLHANVADSSENERNEMEHIFNQNIALVLSGTLLFIQQPKYCGSVCQSKIPKGYSVNGEVN